MKVHSGLDKYLSRVGVMPRDRLSWVFRVVNRYRLHQGADWLPGDWDNMRSELAVFAGIGETLPEWGGIELHRQTGDIVHRPARDETDAILARLHQMVDDAEHHRPFSAPPFRMKRASTWDAAAGRYQCAETWEDLDRATWEDRVRYAFASLLNAEGHRIQRCPSALPHEGKRCGNYFLKSKRQKYCSKTCTSREMTRQKRQRDEQALTTRAKKKGGKSHGTKTRR